MHNYSEVNNVKCLHLVITLWRWSFRKYFAAGSNATLKYFKIGLAFNLEFDYTSWMIMDTSSMRSE